MKGKLLKGGLVVMSAVFITTLGIFASDSIQGVSGLGQLAGVKNSGICASGSVPLTVDGRILCVDIYESSPSKDCPHQELQNAIQSEENASVKNCYAESVEGKSPWNYVTLSQAQRMCASAGKRLPTSVEWYHAALGTDPSFCVINSSQAEKTGSKDCVSGINIHDAVGNVWEWVDEEVRGVRFDDRDLPVEGYVTSVDSQGVALTSGESADTLYGEDYIWTKQEGVFGMLRGGFYGGNNDAGLYSINASVLTSFASQGVGFRCVKDAY